MSKLTKYEQEQMDAVGKWKKEEPGVVGPMITKFSWIVDWQ